MMRILTATLIVLIMFPTSDAEAACLTKSEARSKWPGQRLYWHTKKRCWDNLRVGAKARSHYIIRDKYEQPPLPEPGPRREPPPALIMGPVIPHALLFPPPIHDYAPSTWASEAYAGTPDPAAQQPVNRETKGDKIQKRSNLTVDALMLLIALLLVSLMIAGTVYRWARQRDELRFYR